MGKILSYLFGLKRIPFVRDVATIQIGSILLMGAGFLSSIAFARFLGKETYGQYAVILAFAGTFTAFLNIGQGQSLYVFFSETFGRKDKRAMAAVLANFLEVASVTTLLLLTLAIFMPMLSIRFYGSPVIGQYARILCFFQISEIWNGMAQIILQSVRKIRLKVILEQSANLSSLGLAIVILFFGGGIRAVLVTQLAVSLCFVPVSLGILWLIARELNLPTLAEVVTIPWRESRQYLTQGLIITADKTIGNFFPQGLFFLLSLFIPAAQIGVARIAVQLANIPRSILLPQAGDLSTAVFGKMKTQGVTVMRSNAAKLIKHALVFHALLSFGALIVFPIIIEVFYGLQYAEAIPLTLWLLLVQLIQPIFIINSPLLRLYRRTPCSILVNLTSWMIIGLTIMFFVHRFSTDALFVITYATFQCCQLAISWYVFTRLIPKRAD